MIVALVGLARRLAGDRRGNAAIMFGLSAIPIIGLMGLGVDFYQGLSYRSRLDAAADSAALAAITTAQSYIGANAANLTDVTTPAITAGSARAKQVFPINASSALTYVPTTVSVSMSRTGQTLSATVSYSGTMKTGFAGLFGISTYPIGGTSTASLTMPKYMDFYLMIDSSGSMGLPTSAQGQIDFGAENPDNGKVGCVFACHFTPLGSKGYDCSRGPNGPKPVAGCNKQVDLRADSVGQAVQALLQTATATQTMPQQFRIGLFPFIVHAAPADAGTCATSNSKIYSDFTIPNGQAANLASYLDTGVGITATWPWGSGGTHFENFQKDMQTCLPTSGGDGSSPLSTQPFIFLVTDGMDNNQTFTPSTWVGGSTPQPPPSAFATWCTAEKKAGVNIAILYTPYLNIPVNNGNEVAENTQADSYIPKLAPALTACSSPGFFFAANTAQDINNAMQQMFAQATQAARLTH